MGAIFHISLRNLREHRLKSIIICGLIALSTFLLVLGNSIVDSGRVGLRKTFVQSVSGDVMVAPLKADGTKPGMFSGGYNGPGSEPIKSLPDYPATLDLVKNFPGIESVNPQIYGELQIEIDDDWRAFIGAFGVDAEHYQAMFPDNLELVQGHFLAPGEEGIMLPAKVYDDVLKKNKLRYDVGTKIKISMFGSGTKIKYVPVAGVFKFKNADANYSLEKVGFLDLDSLRYIEGLVVGAASQVKVDAKETSMLAPDATDLDAFFGSGDVVSQGSGAGGGLSDAKLNHILGDTSQRAAMAKADSGTWHYILARVKPGVDPEAVVAGLNKLFADQKRPLVAENWLDASGEVASFASGMQFIFIVLVSLITIISIFVIMNTMVVSISERTAEIGTMRALGAQRNYIRGIFLSEAFLLALVGGLIGLALSGGLLAVLHQVGIPATNRLLAIIFGGTVLHPVLSGSSALWAVAVMLLVGLLSSVYPTRVALRISPVQAMQSN